MPTQSRDLPSSLDVQDQRARAWLAAGKWRQARDALKPLVKADRGRFLPLLIEANVGLARAMLAHGQTSEARQVLNYLATIAPADHMRAVELEFACKTDSSAASLPKLFAALASSNPPLSDLERVRFADRVVLAFEPVPAGDPVQARLVAEVRAIHDALLAVSQARWQAVSESLRAVPHRSVFSHWAVFIKAMAAFHAGETEKVTRLLDSLPPDSAPAQAGRVYRVLVERPPAGGGAVSQISGAVLEGVCRLIGAKGISATMIRAEQQWREGRHAESYRGLREAVPQFPSGDLDWPGALSEFYFKAPHGMRPDEVSKYLLFFADLVNRDRLKNSSETMLAHRMFSLVGSAFAPADELRDDWQSFLREHEATHGENPRLASLAYGWLGEQLSLMSESLGFFSGPPRMRDAEGAVETLRRSIELDPANLAAHLQLCTVYGTLKKSSERNRLLDTMTARFPEDKKVLLHAAQGCIDRKAFNKGLDYLARARQLDQLDPLIPELTLIARRRLARQQFEQRRADKARETLAQTESLWTDKPDDLQRSRWTALIRHGLMEQLWGDAARSQEFLVETRELAPNRAAHLLFAHLGHRTYAKSRRCESPFVAGLRRTLREAPRVGAIGVLFRVLEYWKKAPEPLQTHEEERLIDGALAAALDRPFTRTETIEVIERARGIPEFSKSIRKLVKKFLRGDPLDPQFRLWRLAFDDVRSFIPMANRVELQSILDEAVRRRDESAIRQARQMLRDLDRSPMPNPVDPFFDEDDEDVEELDDLLDVAGMPPEVGAAFEDLIETLRTAPESLIRDLRRKAVREMPEFVFDALLKAAKAGVIPTFPPKSRPKPSRPEPEPKRVTPAKPLPDPNQMNLF